MNVKIFKNELLDLLENVQGVIPTNSSMPQISNVFLNTKNNALNAFGTNLEISISSSVKAEIIESGEVAVEAKKLFLFVKELQDGEILLRSKDNNWLSIRQGETKANLMGINPKDYPKVERAEISDPGLSISSEVLKDMIEKTIYCVSNDETRYHLNGVLFQREKTSTGYRLRMVSTDGHRLSLVERIIGDIDDEAIEKDAGIIIPKKGISEIRKLLDKSKTLLIKEGKGTIEVKGENVLISARLIDGTFPDYRQFVPKGFENKIKVSRDKFISSLRTVGVLTDERSKSITLNIKKENLEITSNDFSRGDAREKLGLEQYKGNQVKIGFNIRYLLDVLNSFDEDSVNLEFKDETSPGVIKPELDKDYTCVVMPMRLDRPKPHTAGQ